LTAAGASGYPAVMHAPSDTLQHHNQLTHRALLRLLERLTAHATARDLPQPLLRQGVDAAVTALRAHHQGEDDVLVPFLRSRPSTTAALTAVHADHERVAAALARLERAPVAELDDCLSDVLRTFADHATREEELLAALDWTQPAPDDVRAVGKALSDHARRHLRPTAVQLPLLLFNLDPDERRAFTDRMPAFVSRALVPWVFRPAWRKLRPFLTHAPPRALGRT
jgi:hypothetical protein